MNTTLKDEDINRFPVSQPVGDYSWRYIENQLKLDVEQGVDLNPDFQRAHVWTMAQQIAYCEFRLRGGMGADVITFAHVGKRPYQTIGMSTQIQDYVLVDGKQRLEAVRRLIRGDLRVFHRPQKPEGYLWSDLDIALQREQNCRFRIYLALFDTRKEILEYYLSLNEGGTQHTQEELDKVRILKDSLSQP